MQTSQAARTAPRGNYNVGYPKQVLISTYHLSQQGPLAGTNLRPTIDYLGRAVPMTRTYTQRGLIGLLLHIANERQRQLG